MSSWNNRPACADRLDLPWTSDSVDVTEWQALTMAAVCQTCPARFECLDALDALDVTGGWWAGVDRDPAAVDPFDTIPMTWRPLTARSGRSLGAQAALDLGNLADGGSAA